MTKRLRLRTAIAALGLAGLGLAPGGAAAPAATARIETGALAGSDEGRVAAFRGIPYAAPPVGDLRWRPPAKPAAWQGVRDATRYGAACPQEPVHKEAWAQVGPTSEDCLFLNVWRPRRAGRYPVMVFLHGGGFVYGAAGVPLYDGARLAERGVVVVTLNYRLGRLGYFAHPALTAESPGGELGNYGVMDQVAALRWVQRNIARFDGDAGNVTLFGESAGAGVVQILMASPVADGLFHKAISQSGAGGTALAPIRGGATSAEASGTAWTASLGLRDATPAQLRAIPLAEVVKGRAMPFIDGKVVPQSPGDGFRRGRQRAMPLMIGSNSHEATLVNDDPRAGKLILGDAYPRLLEAYAAVPGTSPGTAPIRLAQDAGLVLPSLFLADMHAAAGHRTFAYYFTQVPAQTRATALGSEHGGEMSYLFGTQPAGERWDASDHAASRLMGDYWVRFARTGDPNGGGAPSWPAVSGTPTGYLRIGGDTKAARLTPVEEQVKAGALRTAIGQWTAGGGQ